MSKSYLIPHSFSQLNVGSALSQSILAGSTLTVTTAESGDFIILNATGGSAVSVPSSARAAGLDLTFIVGVSAASHTITFPTGTLFGHIDQSTAGSLVAGSTNTSVSSSAGSVGDMFKVVCDGTKFYISGSAAKATGVTFA